MIPAASGLVIQESGEQRDPVPQKKGRIRKFERINVFRRKKLGKA